MCHEYELDPKLKKDRVAATRKGRKEHCDAWCVAQKPTASSSARDQGNPLTEDTQLHAQYPWEQRLQNLAADLLESSQWDGELLSFGVDEVDEAEEAEEFDDATMSRALLSQLDHLGNDAEMVSGLSVSKFMDMFSTVNLTASQTISSSSNKKTALIAATSGASKDAVTMFQLTCKFRDEHKCICTTADPSTSERRIRSAIEMLVMHKFTHSRSIYRRSDMFVNRYHSVYSLHIPLKGRERRSHDS